MGERRGVLIFYLDDRPFGIPAELVEHVYPAVLPLVIPQAPEAIPGIVELLGLAMPLVDMRRKCGFAPRTMRVNDRLIHVRHEGRNLALLVDRVEGVEELDGSEVLDPRELIPGIEAVQGILRDGGELGLLCSLERFFAAEFSFEPAG